MTQVTGCDSLEHLEAIAKRCDGAAEALSPDVLSIRCFYGSGVGFGDVSIFVRHGEGEVLKELRENFGYTGESEPFIRLLTTPKLMTPKATLEGNRVVVRGNATMHGHKARITLEVND